MNSASIEEQVDRLANSPDTPSRTYAASILNAALATRKRAVGLVESEEREPWKRDPTFHLVADAMEIEAREAALLAAALRRIVRKSRA